MKPPLRGQAPLVVALLPAVAALYKCGNPSPGADLTRAVQDFALAEGNVECIRPAPYYEIPKVVVDTWIHVTTINDTDPSSPPDYKLVEQMNVLNAAFAPTGFQYVLRGIDRIVNPAFIEDQVAQKRLLRRGDYKALNLYFQEAVPSDDPDLAVDGDCTFPGPFESDSPDFFLDGCRLSFSTLPGAPAPTDMGKVAVHEVGHWNGLLHTFTGGCAEEHGGDMVCDTPAEAKPEERPEPQLGACPEGRDTCPGAMGPSQMGLDPIHNYMDYSSDACYTEFTPGQIRYMHNMWLKFRQRW